MNGNFDEKLSLYLRSERAMLDIFFRNTLRQIFFMILGFIALLTALIMLDIALFFTLQNYFKTHLTAFILSGSHVFLFFIFYLLAKHKKHQQETKALRDIRDFAKDHVTHDLKIATDEVVHVGKSVKRMTHDISSIFSSEAFGLVGLIPLIQRIIKS